MSWKSSTEKLAWPPWLASRFFSPSVCSTMAVDDIDSTQPAATPTVHDSPISMAMPVMAAMVSTTCSPPSPSSCQRSCHSLCGSSSRPTRNSIITTPNSATCWMLSVSWPTRPKTGPIRTPAIR